MITISIIMVTLGVVGISFLVVPTTSKQNITDETGSKTNSGILKYMNHLSILNAWYVTNNGTLIWHRNAIIPCTNSPLWAASWSCLASLNSPSTFSRLLWKENTKKNIFRPYKIKCSSYTTNVFVAELISVAKLHVQCFKLANRSVHLEPFVTDVVDVLGQGLGDCTDGAVAASKPCTHRDEFLVHLRYQRQN